MRGPVEPGPDPPDLLSVTPSSLPAFRKSIQLEPKTNVEPFKQNT